MRQAPDTREFRIYLQPDSLNAVPGRIAAVAPASATESDVQTDIANLHGADAYVGAWLRLGANAFRVIGSEAGEPLALRVKNIGAADEITPSSGAACTLTVPQVYNTGTVSVTRGLPVVTGTNAEGINEGACHQVAEEQLVQSPTAFLKFLPTALSKKADRPKQKSGSVRLREGQLGVRYCPPGHLAAVSAAEGEAVKPRESRHTRL
jgi:hypothetical protein